MRPTHYEVRQLQRHRARKNCVHDDKSSIHSQTNPAPHACVQDEQMSAPLVSGEQVIRGAPVGSMIYSRAKFDRAGDWQTVLLIRETKDFVRGLGTAPVIELRGGVIEDTGAVLVVVIAKIAGELYECWFNYWGSELTDCFADLAKQERIALVFFTPGRARALHIKNGLREFFADAARRCRDRGRWAMADFDVARDRTYTEYPEVRNLWAHLAAKK